MPCTEPRGLGIRAAAVALVALAGCSSPPAPPPPPAAPKPAAGATAPRPATPGPAAPVAAAPRAALPAPRAARSWDEFKEQAARRLVAANPEGTYMTRPPEPLLAIPVLEIELNGDGSVRHIRVLRVPTQAKDTTQLAIDAVHRAAPFGDVTRLPRPWKFAEVFLFDDDRRFKPRTLD